MRMTRELSKMPEECNEIGKMGKFCYKVVRISRPEPKYSELGLAFDILRRCTDRLKESGHSYWNSDRLYKKFDSMIKEGDIRLVYECNIPISTFTLLDMPPQEIRKLWGEKADEPAAYLRALAVIPEKQMMGIGGVVLNGIENIISREKKLGVMRFHTADVLKGYFHEKMGYPIHKEHITGGKYNLILFEKMLGEQR